MITKEPFGSSFLFKISDGAFSVQVIPVGAAIRSLIVPDRAGRPVDVILGYDAPEEYLNPCACGAVIVGRVANRISNARFSLNGTEYKLDANEGPNTLHGGGIGYGMRRWNLRPDGDNSVICTLSSPDGDQGFPGNLVISVRYTLENGALSIRYTALSDADTVLNLTNHAYFNLSGHNSGDVSGHIVSMNAECFTPTDSNNLTTGEIRSVENSAWDLRRGARLRDRFGCPELAATHGYDHNFPLSGSPAAKVYSPESGIAMVMETDLPAAQLYTACWLSPHSGKGGARYERWQGLCLETQHYPDAINKPNFPSPVLPAGKLWESETVFRFSVK